jgi:hypothetical protein
MATVGLLRDTAIKARAPEEAKVTAMMTAAWRVGSVLISNANFMPKKFWKRGEIASKKRKECAGKVRSCERKEPGTMQPTKLRQ